MARFPGTLAHEPHSLFAFVLCIRPHTPLRPLSVNLFTHARWGRGQETFTEDPFLSARLAVAYVRGMQGPEWGEGARYVEAGATCKHFFSYGSSNQTQLNHLNVSETDLLQTYYPSFEACIREGRARSIMCSYSTVNGYQGCEQPVLQAVLRDQWHFDGFVTADDGAISLIVAPNVTVKAAKALSAGCDMGGEFSSLGQALNLGLVTEQQIDVALNRSLTVRIQLGKMDPPSMVPWSSYDLSMVDTASSRALARRAARESNVLLKNDGAFLPLSLSSEAPFSRSPRATAALTNIAVIGPNADRQLTLLGNYCGCEDGQPGGPIDPPITKGCVLVTPYQAIRAKVAEENRRREGSASAAAAISVTYNKGADINSTDTRNFSAAVSLVRAADVAVLVMGIGTCVGPWSGLPSDCIEAEAWDRTEMGLTGVQPRLMRELIATGTPLVLVLMSGSPLLINEWVASPHVLSVVQNWYSGEEGGNGLVDILFGDYSPSGKLPVTFPFSEAQVPANDQDYDMRAGSGRTYRYSTVIPLYNFGYGLSYTTFSYARDPSVPVLAPLTLNATDAAAQLTVTAQLSNAGTVDADEVVELYVAYTGFSAPSSVQSIPRTELKGFQRVSVAAGGSARVSFNVSAASLRLVGADGALGLLKGTYIMQIGGSAPGSRGQAVDGDNHHGGRVEVERPAISGEAAVCEEGVGYWTERDLSGERPAGGVYGKDSATALIDVPVAINGGLTAVLTVC